MAVQLITLRDMPEDELQDIRQLLDEHRFEFYETPPNHWGISAGAIWLIEDTDLALAKPLLAQYQQARSERIRAAYQAQKALGTHPNFLQALMSHPIKVVAFLGLAAAVLYVSLMPFLYLR